MYGSVSKLGVFVMIVFEGWRDGGMDGWREGWMDGWMDGWMKEGRKKRECGHMVHIHRGVWGRDKLVG
jgi:hypothetical protein